MNNITRTGLLLIFGVEIEIPLTIWRFVVTIGYYEK